MSHKGDNHGPKHEPNNNKKNEIPKGIALLDFVTDPNRKISLVGLRYLVALNLKGSTECIFTCNLCMVKGTCSNMKNHLTGIDHLTAYLEKHYMFLLKGLKAAGYVKNQLGLLMREYAKQIERLEGTSGIQVAYVSESEFKKEQETLVDSKNDCSKFEPQEKYPLYRRKMALLYSRNFKISSQTEASGVLNLSEQLSNQLEQYHLKSKEQSAQGSSGTNCTITTNQTAPNMLPPTGNENNDHTTKLENTIMKSSWDTEGPSTSSMNQYSANYTQSQLTENFHDSSMDHFSNFEAIHEKKCLVAPNVTDAKELTNTDDENYTADPDQSSSDTSSSHEQSSEMPSERPAHGKTSKTLSPDILLLLKGKDASAVTNILKTLTTFYPALQDVNLEILGQVLVNTGVLD